MERIIVSIENAFDIKLTRDRKTWYLWTGIIITAVLGFAFMAFGVGLLARESTSAGTGLLISGIILTAASISLCVYFYLTERRKDPPISSLADMSRPVGGSGPPPQALGNHDIMASQGPESPDDEAYRRYLERNRWESVEKVCGEPEYDEPPGYDDVMDQTPPADEPAKPKVVGRHPNLARISSARMVPPTLDGATRDSQPPGGDIGYQRQPSDDGRSHISPPSGAPRNAPPARPPPTYLVKSTEI